MTPPDAAAPAAVIGLEIHIQLATEHKLFSPARRAHRPDQPNQDLDPFSIGLPGALPVLNRDAILPAVRTAFALGCTVHVTSAWDRKHYFYPDLPKGYQITQQREPLATDGALEILGDDGATRTIRIQRVHLEEDAGKSVHGRDGYTRVDFNRAGAPLIEVVSAPDLDSPAEARRFLRRLRSIVRAIGASSAHMEQGEFRCDANISLGGTAPGPRVEIKNLNSFRFVEQALAHEITRQRQARRDGLAIGSETRLWDPSARKTRPMRAKESGVDYRYLPEPDLPALTLSASWLAEVKAGLPELPDARGRRYRTAGVDPATADTLAESGSLGPLLDAVIAEDIDLAPAAATLLVTEVSRLRNEAPDAPLRLSHRSLVRLTAWRQAGRISSTQQKNLLARAWSENTDIPDDWIQATLDRDSTFAAIEEVLDGHPEVVDKYVAGKRGVLGFLVGAVMKATEGQADPQAVREWLEQRLEKIP